MGPVRQSCRSPAQRGSVLVTALLFSLLLAIGLGSYLTLSRANLSHADRTFWQNDAHNLAEAGLEEALFCFRKMSGGASAPAVWANWTLNGSDATFALPSFDRDSRGVGTVKVYVHGYDGSDAAPYILSQASIVPFDGSAPVTKTLRLTLKSVGLFSNGIVGLEGLRWNGHPTADSFNSNPSGSVSGPWAPYSASAPRSNTTVVVLGGSANLGAQGLVKGDLSLAAGMSEPSASQVTGTINKNVSGTFPLPTYPTQASVSRSYDVGASLPASLPAAGHAPASDGNYYYFCTGATIGATTITTGKNVVIVGKDTQMGSGLSIAGTGSCKIYIDGKVDARGNGAINNENWAGALQIFTSTTEDCKIGGNGRITACLYAPNAKLLCDGGGNSGMLIGSYVANTITSNGHMDFHYDEALKLLPGAGWKVQGWYNFQTGADRALVSTLSNGFLQ